jgi:hypothetical protein
VYQIHWYLKIPLYQFLLGITHILQDRTLTVAAQSGNLTLVPVEYGFVVNDRGIVSARVGLSNNALCCKKLIFLVFSCGQVGRLYKSACLWYVLWSFG